MATQRQQLEQLSKALDVVSGEQLSALQSRLQALHEAQLLSEDEVYSVEE